MVAFQPTESVLEYLMRIQSDQKNLTKPACVPWYELSHQTSHPIEDIIPAVQEMKSIALWLAKSSLYKQVGEFTKHVEYD